MAVDFLNENTRRFFMENNFLYRVITLDRFIELQNDKFAFVSPTLWSDPYEKAFLEAKYHFQGKEYNHPLYKQHNQYKLFAQCWTQGSQTEAMWRGFAPNKDGVMFKIATDRLLHILNILERKSSFHFILGFVDYINEKDLYDMKTQHEIWDSIARKDIDQHTLSLIFNKRQAFNFEKEIRVLAIKRTKPLTMRVIKFDVENILNYFEYVKFDPRIGEELFKFTRDALKEQYPDLNIHKSRLYNNPIQNLYYGERRPPVQDDEIILTR